MSNLKDVFVLLRPNQWIKNLFVFIPIFFAGELKDVEKIKGTILAFCAFCFVASSIYILNDMMDIEADRQHPEKCKRPLASGHVSAKMAGLTFGILVLSGIFITYQTHNYLFSAIVLSYFLLNIGYSLGLKKLSIIEILIVSSGFVLRAIGGGMVAEVEVSQWMLMMIFY